MGTLLITPAAAHVTESFNHLWNKHLKPILTDAGTINDAGNPVDWTKLKGVPGGLADGVDDTGGPPGPATDVQCTGCVTSGDLGTLTVRTGTVLVEGGTAHNSKYVLGDVSKYCLAGEEAISWSAFWDGDLNPGGAGGDDDAELTIASAEFDIEPGNAQGYIVYGGNDSGVNHTLTLQVRCLAA